MPAFELAQANIARLRAPIGSPLVQPFVDSLDSINASAEAAPGCIWRLKGERNDAADMNPYEDPLLILNVSVWKDIQHLGAYVFRGPHAQAMRRREEWFEPLEGSTALWWIPAGSRPDAAEAKARLALLQSRGPSPEAFCFHEPFPQPRRD